MFTKSIKQQLKILFILTIFSTSNPLVSQNIKEKKFEETVYKVIKFYNAKESHNINNLINTQIGCYILSTPGAQVCWQNVKNIPLSNNDSVALPIPINDKLIHQHLPTHYKLEYKAYPKMNCEYPSMNGLFVDTTKINREPSTSIKSLANTMDGEIKHSWMTDYHKIYKLETNSRKIVLASNETSNTDGLWDSSFIFYLTYIKNNWYLTIMDHTDCFLTD